ncbi:YdeI/OmpD-associated family protein [Yoonia sp. 208BN28-4]|uniref:YdeI/OmpD-associated family protein n=1 Tax=Yoonia sp. 208BN28-4 TaxID=3126505 RepID=UPI00309CF263
MSKLDDAEQVTFDSVPALRDWLAAHHTQPDGIWSVTYKKADPRYVAVTDIVDQCLCFGWVDSLTRGKDDFRTMLYLAPRNPKSNWSRVNKDKIARLEDSGQMTDAGRAVVQRAKFDGTWTALDDVENLVIPTDLQASFDATPGAEAAWHAFPRSVKRGALEILLNAKRPATRAAKIATIVDDSTAGRRPFQWRKS